MNDMKYLFLFYFSTMYQVDETYETSYAVIRKMRRVHLLN